jgi:hypothetical protein
MNEKFNNVYSAGENKITVEPLFKNYKNTRIRNPGSPSSSSSQSWIFSCVVSFSPAALNTV